MPEEIILYLFYLYMDKNYHHWHKIKTTINNEKKTPLFQEQEIWWTLIGNNIGIEQDGKGSTYMRPVLILRKYSKYHFVGIPLTTKTKESPHYISLKRVSFLHDTSTLIISQIRTFDSKRLFRKMGKISDNTFAQVQKKSVLGLIPGPRVPNGNSN